MITLSYTYHKLTLDSIRNEPRHDKTNKIKCTPSEDSDQPGHPASLIRVFSVRMTKACALSYLLSAQRSLLSDWVDAQADLSLRWAHIHFVGFVTRRLKCQKWLMFEDTIVNTAKRSSEKIKFDFHFFFFFFSVCL